MTDFTLLKKYDQCKESVMAVARPCIINYWLLRCCQCSCVHPKAGDVSCWNSSPASQGNRLTHWAGSSWLLGPVPVSQGTWPAWTLLWTRRKGCRGNLEGSGARGESPRSTGKEALLILMLVGKKISKQQSFFKLKNTHGLQQEYFSHKQIQFFTCSRQENQLHIPGNSCICESPDKGAYSRVTHRTNKLHEILYSTISQLWKQISLNEQNTLKI